MYKPPYQPKNTKDLKDYRKALICLLAVYKQLHSKAMITGTLQRLKIVNDTLLLTQ